MTYMLLVHQAQIIEDAKKDEAPISDFKTNLNSI